MAKKFIIQGTNPPKMNFNSSQNIKQIQDFNNSQIYTMGFPYNTQANANNSYSPALGGKARQLHGIVILFPIASQNEDDEVNLNINSENIITNVNWRAFNPVSATGNSFKNAQYFEMKRALSGSDSVLLNVKSNTAHAFSIVFYLSNM